MRPGDRRRGRLGAIEIEDGPFAVTAFPEAPRQSPRFGEKVDQVRVRVLTGPLQGERRQWAVGWVERHFPRGG